MSFATVLCSAILIAAIVFATRYDTSVIRNENSTASNSTRGDAVVCDRYIEIEREYLRALEIRRQVRGRAAGSRLRTIPSSSNL
jgi:hypothetical protein